MILTTEHSKLIKYDIRDNIWSNVYERIRRVSVSVGGITYALFDNVWLVLRNIINTPPTPTQIS
jgi:hypothetical protein